VWGDSCVDTDRGATDSFGDSCSVYFDYPWTCGNYDYEDFNSNTMCCVCKGENCSIGYFGSSTGGMCERCPSGSTTPSVNSSSIADCLCSRGWYGSPTGDNCIQCPAGYSTATALSVNSSTVADCTECDAASVRDEEGGCVNLEREDLKDLYCSTNREEWTQRKWNISDAGRHHCDFDGVSNYESRVIDLSLSDNGMVGRITNLEHRTKLEELYLYSNKLTGEIPSFSTLTSLKTLRLSNTKLTGEIPSFATLTNLYWLYLSDNKLTGEIPSFSTLTNLGYLYLSNNTLTGEISSLSTLTRLYDLDLSDNKLTGLLPTFETLTNLYNLQLQNNFFTGSVPDKL